MVSGLLKSAHTVLSGVLFAKYHDACPYLAVVQTSEQLVGLVRSLLSAVFIMIAAAVLYTQVRIFFPPSLSLSLSPRSGYRERDIRFILKILFQNFQQKTFPIQHV
ncbi:unnamed protein product [Dibothriocephalus latus]|uniref:Uncharacterized protein n=1 Tax=Dibothriocephalus latus TaxID=60516 RepID=A0A3P6R7X9_DIBLA|nr:unnamed protein product [Dibothriocephalus latus]